MNKLVLLLIITSELFSVSASARVTSYRERDSKTVCNDGSYSTSTGSGSCSSHGGVDYYM